MPDQNDETAALRAELEAFRARLPADGVEAQAGRDAAARGGGDPSRAG